MTCSEPTHPKKEALKPRRELRASSLAVGFFYFPLLHFAALIMSCW
jgi:hypothetical protein